MIEVNNLLKIYFKGEEIALHPLCKDLKGEHITDNTHYPANKNITGKEILSRQQEEMKEIGENAFVFFQTFCNKGVMQKYDYRTISGILALRSKYKNVVIDKACKRALYYNSITYGTVKKICEKGLIALPVEHNESFVNEDVTEMARDLSCYTQLSLLGVIDNE